MVARNVKRSRFTIVGYWSVDKGPEDYVDKTWKGSQRRAVLAFIKAGVEVNHTKGWANCRLCGVPLGACDVLLPGGKYLCPKGFDHYIKSHNLKPDTKFIDVAVKWYVKNKPMEEKPFLKLIIDVRTGEVVYKRLLKSAHYKEKVLPKEK